MFWVIDWIGASSITLRRKDMSCGNTDAEKKVERKKIDWTKPIEWRNGMGGVVDVRHVGSVNRANGFGHVVAICSSKNDGTEVIDTVNEKGQPYNLADHGVFNKAVEVIQYRNV